MEQKYMQVNHQLQLFYSTSIIGVMWIIQIVDMFETNHFD